MLKVTLILWAVAMVLGYSKDMMVFSVTPEEATVYALTDNLPTRVYAVGVPWLLTGIAAVICTIVTIAMV